jgi:hypothetical protein
MRGPCEAGVALARKVCPDCESLRRGDEALSHLIFKKIGSSSVAPSALRTPPNDV